MNEKEKSEIIDRAKLVGGNYYKDVISLILALEEEPLKELTRAELQLNIMKNIETEIMTKYKKTNFAFWWKNTCNWVKVQLFINGRTAKQGLTSSIAQCRFIGANPYGKSFIEIPVKL